jgi:Predicted transcriptional regulators
MKIGELSKKTGLPVSAIRYYEDLKIIQSKRTDSGYREFVPETVELLGLLMQAKSLGFSLKEIKEMALLMRSGVLNKDKLRARFELKLAELDMKVREIRSFQKNLKAVMAKACPF